MNPIYTDISDNNEADIFTKIIRCYKAILPKHNIHIIADEFNAHLGHQHELKCLHVQLIINRIRINEYL